MVAAGRLRGRACGGKADGEPVDFQALFLAQDEEDEDDNALVEALITLRTWAAARKKAADKTLAAGSAEEETDAAAARQKALLVEVSDEEETKSAAAARQRAADGKFSAADLMPEIKTPLRFCCQPLGAASAFASTQKMYGAFPCEAAFSLRRISVSPSPFTGSPTRVLSRMPIAFGDTRSLGSIFGWNTR